MGHSIWLKNCYLASVGSDLNGWLRVDGLGRNHVTGPHKCILDRFIINFSFFVIALFNEQDSRTKFVLTLVDSRIFTWSFNWIAQDWHKALADLSIYDVPSLTLTPHYSCLMISGFNLEKWALCAWNSFLHALEGHLAWFIICHLKTIRKDGHSTQCFSSVLYWLSTRCIKKLCLV